MDKKRSVILLITLAIVTLGIIIVNKTTDILHPVSSMIIAICLASGWCVALALALYQKRKVKFAMAVIFIVLVTSFLLSALFSNMLPETSITIIATGEKNEKSMSEAVSMTVINLDWEYMNLEQLCNDDWQIGEWGELFSTQGAVTLVLKEYFSLGIGFYANPYSGIMEIITPAGTQFYDLYRAEGSEHGFELYIPFVSTPPDTKTVLMETLLMIAGVCAMTVLQIKLGLNCRILHILYGYVIGAFIVTSIYVKWDVYSCVLFILLSGYIAYSTLPIFISGKWKKYAPTYPKRAVLLVIIIYSTFACTYNQIVLETMPWVENAGFHTITFVLLWILFWIMTLFAFIQGFEALQKKFVRKIDAATPEKPDIMLLWLEVFGVIMVGLSIGLIAFFPANMSPDSMHQWGQAIGVLHLDDWHPIIHTLLIRFSILFIDSPFMPVLFQSIILASVYATASVYFYKLGLKKVVILIVAAIVALAPNNVVYAATLWKDVAFAIAMLAMTLSLQRLAFPDGERTWVNEVMLVLAIFFVAAVRHNGIVPAVAGAVLASVFLYKRFKRIIPFVGLFALFFTKMVIYPIAIGTSAIDTVGTTASYIIFPVAAVIAEDGDLDERYKDILTQHNTVEDWKAGYNPYRGVSLPISLNFDARTKVGMYLDALINNPVIVARAHLAWSDISWPVFQSSDPASLNNRIGRGIIQNEFGLVQKYNKLNPIMHTAIDSTSSITITDIFLWRTGIYIIFLLMLSYIMWLTKSFKYTLIVAPLIFNFLAGLLINGAPDYRYTYQVFLCFPVIALYFLTVAGRKPLLTNLSV